MLIVSAGPICTGVSCGLFGALLYVLEYGVLALGVLLGVGGVLMLLKRKLVPLAVGLLLLGLILVASYYVPKATRQQESAGQSLQAAQEANFSLYQPPSKIGDYYLRSTTATKSKCGVELTSVYLNGDSVRMELTQRSSQDIDGTIGQYCNSRKPLSSPASSATLEDGTRLDKYNAGDMHTYIVERAETMIELRYCPLDEAQVGQIIDAMPRASANSIRFN